MKNLLSLIFILFSITNSFSQEFEGKINFNITYAANVDEQIKEAGPKEALMYFSSDRTRIEMQMGMGMKNVTISDLKEKQTIVLMDMMGQKIAMKSSIEDEKVDEKTKVEVTSQTKKIAGYSCKKAIITTPESEGGNVVVWFTNDLVVNKGYLKGAMKKIDGTVLEYTVKQGPMEFTLSADKVERQKVDGKLFTIPEGYKMMDQKDLMKSFGGGQ